MAKFINKPTIKKKSRQSWKVATYVLLASLILENIWLYTYLTH